MKDRIIGWTIILIGTFLLLKAWDNFANIWYLLTEMPDHRPTMDYLIIIGQGATYVTMYCVAIVFGVSLLRDKGKKRIKTKRLTFLTILTVWILLEIPVHNCDFGQSRHSFWFSHKTHFHWRLNEWLVTVLTNKDWVRRTGYNNVFASSGVDA